MFPPTSLPYVPPRPRNLGASGPTLREQVVAGLFLPPAAPPAPVAVRLVDLLEIWADGRVPRQGLAVAACYRLTRPAEGSPPDAIPVGGLYFRCGPTRSEIR